MGKLTESAKEILNANLSSKQGGNKSSDWSHYGDGVNKNVGDIGTRITKVTDSGGDFTKGVPKATPPGATPPVGSEKDGVGTSKARTHQPAEDGDKNPDTSVMDHEDLDNITNRKASKLPKQTFASMGKSNYSENLDLTDDVNALLEGEELSEDFRMKATTIFEAAVSSRIQTIAEQIEVELTEQFDEAVEEVKNQLSERLDDYLDYMVEEWMKSNEIAIASSLRAEIVEDFMSKLHNLFVESYIDIPEEKVDVVEELSAQVEALEAKLDEELKNNIELTKSINEHQKTEAIHAVCEGLTLTQVEKLKSLAEGVEFTTDEEFSTKLNTLKESYFQGSVKQAEKTSLNEDLEYPEDEATKNKTSVDPVMDIYAKTIAKTLKV